jgi:hypothetical protein
MALRTRSRSTCLRPTSKGSTALIALASHAPVPSVHPAPVIGAAGRGARSCASRSRQRLYPPGLFRSAGKLSNRYQPEMPWAPRAGSPGGPDGPAQRRPAAASAGQRRPAPSGGQRRLARVSGGQRRSALADPGHRRLGLTGRKVLAITPVAAGAVVVMALPAWNADHAPIFSLFLFAGTTKSAPRPGLAWHRAAARTS